MIASGHLTSQQAWDSVDIPTVGMLFGLMIVSAQFGSSGFYGQVTARLSALQVGDRTLLLVVIIVTGVLSALLTNDIVVFAMTPVLLAGCIQRRLDPIPFMLGAMCAANIGSAATLIGNPQVIFIGQRFDLSFNAYLLDSLVPVLLSLVVSWLVICLVLRGSWSKAGEGAGGAAGGTEGALIRRLESGDQLERGRRRQVDVRVADATAIEIDAVLPRRVGQPGEPTADEEIEGLGGRRAVRGPLSGSLGEGVVGDEPARHAIVVRGRARRGQQAEDRAEQRSP